MTGPGRYHLRLRSGGRPVQHGWWDREETARDKYRRWIGEYGGMPGASVTLTDEETGEVLATWPDAAPDATSDAVPDSAPDER